MSNKDVLKYISNISQLGGTRPYELTDGWARKMRAIDVNTGSGLQYTVLPDRGLDISLASFKGKNLTLLVMEKHLLHITSPKASDGCTHLQVVY
jgi:hypothetical protein